VIGRGSGYGAIRPTSGRRRQAPTKTSSKSHWGAERSSRGCRTPSFLLKRGRSAAFAHPALNALEARHVWLPKPRTPTFFATPLPAVPATGVVGIVVPALPGLEQILVDARGRQHVVLRAHGASLQFVVDGADVTAGPVRFSLVMRSLTAIHEPCAQLEALRRILSLASTPGPTDWTAAALNLRNALIAIDGRAAGASYREIAVVLYGPEYVASNWLELKERVRRHLRRGRTLSRGGYRNFLK
jgi:hypothetical protein